MKSVAYLSNSFPEPMEPYVAEEIAELRARGCNVLACSFRRPSYVPQTPVGRASDTLYVFPLRLRASASASWLCISKVVSIADLLWRGIGGPEPLGRRVRNLFHTCLGAYLATILRGKNIGHIHIHHGYFSTWAGMVAARFLGASFSMTLHGSDLLLRGDYLDSKLANCHFCVTISEFNRRFIHDHHPSVDQRKVVVHRLGVDLDFWHALAPSPTEQPFTILSVGRLHRVKNHEFLLQACHALKDRGIQFRCAIAGSGEERDHLQQLLSELNLQARVTLLGHVPREQLPRLYADADVVVLTSRSEGIPVTLMEALAMERIVLAPDMTGIPELIRSGETGFLYQQGSLDDFVAKLDSIRIGGSPLDSIRGAARNHIKRHFNARRNLAAFATDFLKRVGEMEHTTPSRIGSHENSVLQQIQLRVQRD